jgi:hypothetical protein
MAKKPMPGRCYPDAMRRVPVSDVMMLRLMNIADPSVPRIIDSIIGDLRSVAAQHRAASADTRREITLWTKGHP